MTIVSYFTDGFCAVFPMEKLCPFTPDELQLMLSGEQVPQWTIEDIMNYTEPKFGYTRETPGFQRFVNVLVNMSGDERKVIINFTYYSSTANKHKLIGLKISRHILSQSEGRE